MKKFKSFVAEVAEPKGGDEKRFKDKHVVAKTGHPVATDDQFVAKTTKDKSKRAGYHNGEDEKVYESADVSTKRADKKPVIVHDTDPKTGQSKTRTKMVRSGSIKVEETELGEVLKPSDDMKKWIDDFQKSDDPKFKGKSKEKRREMAIAAKYAAEREAGMREEVELDEKAYVSSMSPELGRKGSHDVIGKDGKVVKSYPYTKQGMSLAQKHLEKMKEEVEQIDELSPNTLHSYIKGASKDLAKRSRMSGYDDKRGNYADGDKNRKRANKRMAGIASASGRLADKANMAENAWEEVPMMVRQLEFMAYAAEEIMEYLEMGIDPEEWFQNKLAHMHDQMQSLYAYAQGDKKVREAKMGYSPFCEGYVSHAQRKAVWASRNDEKEGKKKKKTFKEMFELEEDIRKMSHSRLKFHATKNVPHGSFSNSEIEDEHERRKKTDPSYQKAKPSMSEEVEYFDEAFKSGSMKLKDGSSVKITNEDASALNDLMNELNSSNKKRMEEELMKNKSGFDKVLKFAREAQ